jgi:F-type H+-transporting ATPase subunit b
VLQQLLLAQAEEGHGNPILPATNELIFGTLAFLVLLFLLSRFVFPRVNALLEERASNIEGKLERAERDRREAEELRERRRAQLQAAREEAASIVEDGRRRGEDVRRDIVARAERDAERLVARAQEQIRSEHERAVAEVRRDMGRLAVELAGRLVGESMDGERQRRLVDRFLDQLERTAGEGSGGGTGEQVGGEGVRGRG